MSLMEEKIKKMKYYVFFKKDMQYYFIIFKKKDCFFKLKLMLIYKIDVGFDLKK